MKRISSDLICIEGAYYNNFDIYFYSLLKIYLWKYWSLCKYLQSKTILIILYLFLLSPSIDLSELGNWLEYKVCTYLPLCLLTLDLSLTQRFLRQYLLVRLYVASSLLTGNLVFVLIISAIFVGFISIGK